MVCVDIVKSGFVESFMEEGFSGIQPEVGYPKQFRIQSTHSRTKSEIDSLVNELCEMAAGQK